MTIKTILIPVDGDEAVEKVLDTAQIIAQRFGSHICAIHVSENTLQSYNYVSNLPKALKDSVANEENVQLDSLAENIYQQLVSYCRDRELSLAKQSQQTREANSVSWLHAKGPVSQTLIDYARLNDVTLLNRPSKSKSTFRRGQALSMAETIMVKSGRPVLLIPPQWKVRKCEHAVIGWNQSLESSKAVAMTIPWLSQMEKVTVVVARSREESGHSLINYLAWHDVEAQIQILNRGSTSAGERLLQLCDEIEADFLVMGAYGAAKIEKYLFGGVTNYVLNNAQIITVMVH